MSRLTRNLLAAASIPAIAMGLVALAGQAVETRIAAGLAASGIAAERVDASLVTGRIALSGLTGRSGDSAWRVGRLTASGSPALVGPALAADPVVLQDLSFSYGSAFTMRLPKLEVTGADLGKDALAALFAPTAAEPIAARLTRLNATSLVAPELVFVQKVGETTQTTTYRNVTARDVARGRIARLAGDGATLASTATGKEAMSGTYGAWSVDNVDLPLGVRLYADKARPDEKPAPIYANYVMADIVMRTGAGHALEIKQIRSESFAGMPGAEPMLTALEAIEKAPANDDEKLKQATRLLGLLGAYEIGQTDMTGFTFSFNEDGKTGKGRIARMGMSMRATMNFAIEGFEVETAEARIAMAGMSLKDLSVTEVLSTLKDVASDPAKAAQINPANLVPRFGRFEVTGISVDAQDTTNKDQRTKADIKAFAIETGAHIGPIPTAMAIRLDNIRMKVPERSKDENLRRLIAMGYRDIDLSLRLDTAWDQGRSELAIRELTAEGPDMGTLRLSGTLGNVDKDVFSTDPAVAQVAAMAATARTLTINVDDRGLFNRWLADHARQVKRKPEDLRVEYGRAAVALVPALLGPGEGPRAAGAAIGRFIAKPGKLEIAARTKDGTGLGIADFMMLSDPTAIGQRLEITAKAE